MYNARHCVVFNANQEIKRRTSGAYRFANQLEGLGWRVTVIDWVDDWPEHKLVEYLDAVVADDTLMFAWSYTWMKPWWAGHAIKQVKARYPGRKHIAGGQQFFQHHLELDAMLYGYAEVAVPLVLDWLFDGGPKPKGKDILGGLFVDCNTDYKAMNLGDYGIDYRDDDYIQDHELLTVELSRGCKFQCKYCNYAFLGIKEDTSTEAELLRAELIDNYERFGTTNYILADDTLNDLQTLVPCYDLDPLVNSDNQGSEIDDCDIESFNLIYSWPDSNTAPEKIIFHVTDNDGAVASAEINIDVRNVKPNPGMTTSEYNPTSGDVVVLTGNGTTDSLNDMENMIYSWDMDISKDSNGDGDKTNDQDILGKIVEWEFNDAGSIVVQLTVDDGDSSDSMRITIQVKEKPFSVTAFILSPIGILIIAVLILSIVVLPTILKKRNKIEHDEFKVPSKGTIDDAFDDPEYDPFSDDSKKQKISKQRIKKEQNKPDTKTDQLDKDLVLDKNIDTISDNDSENIDLEDKNLAINEVLTASEIEELIGEEE